MSRPFPVARSRQIVPHHHGVRRWVSCSTAIDGTGAAPPGRPDDLGSPAITGRKSHMWPFKKRGPATAGLMIDPTNGDPQVRALVAAVAARDGATIRAILDG